MKARLTNLLCVSAFLKMAGKGKLAFTCAFGKLQNFYKKFAELVDIEKINYHLILVAVLP